MEEHFNSGADGTWGRVYDPMDGAGLHFFSDPAQETPVTRSPQTSYPPEDVPDDELWKEYMVDVPETLPEYVPPTSPITSTQAHMARDALGRYAGKAMGLPLYMDHDQEATNHDRDGACLFWLLESNRSDLPYCHHIPSCWIPLQNSHVPTTPDNQNVHHNILARGGADPKEVMPFDPLAKFSVDASRAEFLGYYKSREQYANRDAELVRNLRDVYANHPIPISPTPEPISRFGRRLKPPQRALESKESLDRQHATKEKNKTQEKNRTQQREKRPAASGSIARPIASLPKRALAQSRKQNHAASASPAPADHPVTSSSTTMPIQGQKPEVGTAPVDDNKAPSPPPDHSIASSSTAKPVRRRTKVPKPSRQKPTKVDIPPAHDEPASPIPSPIASSSNTTPIQNRHMESEPLTEKIDETSLSPAELYEKTGRTGLKIKIKLSAGSLRSASPLASPAQAPTADVESDPSGDGNVDQRISTCTQSAKRRRYSEATTQVAARWRGVRRSRSMSRLATDITADLIGEVER